MNTSASDLSESQRHVLVAVAWPYANGESHLGHLAGAYLPSDIFARYHRILGSKVLMVSGADAHGTPITVKAEAEGVGPADIVNRYQAKFLEQWDKLGISFDLFTTTMTDNHRDATQDMFRVLHDKGYIDSRVTEQYFDPEAGRFLPDRYVEGTCPNCAYTNARGDQCDNCGKTLDPIDLVDPRSKLTGATPERRETEHYFILLSKLQDEVKAWLETKSGWRPHVINWALGLLNDEGLLDRAITRDLDWGVPIPDGFDTIGEGVLDYLERYEPDALRYALAGILPETNDTDLTEEGMVERINNELVAAWGNLVNRVVSMTGKYFDGVVPQEGEREPADLELLAKVDGLLAEQAELFEQVELRAALRKAVEGASAANTYLSDQAPWKVAKTDMDRTATILRTTLDAINGLKVMFAPIVPFSSQTVHEMLGNEGAIEDHGWRRHPVTAGTQLAPAKPLYAKVELPEDDEA